MPRRPLAVLRSCATKRIVFLREYSTSVCRAFQAKLPSYKLQSCRLFPKIAAIGLRQFTDYHAVCANPPVLAEPAKDLGTSPGRNRAGPRNRQTSEAPANGGVGKRQGIEASTNGGTGAGACPYAISWPSFRRTPESREILSSPVAFSRQSHPIKVGMKYSEIFALYGPGFRKPSLIGRV